LKGGIAVFVQLIVFVTMIEHPDVKMPPDVIEILQDIVIRPAEFPRLRCKLRLWVSGCLKRESHVEPAEPRR
jgi:hypothetical protein